LFSGDLNNDGKLDANESWKYTCTSTLASNTTNTAIATGRSSDGYYSTAIDTAIVTVVVGTPVQPPLINVVKVPSRLTPFPLGGGDVTYTYTITNPGVVAMNNVTLSDDKCPTVYFISGDNNRNNLLDTNESWIYSCKQNIKVSTGNVATVKGNANGFTAIAYAFVNVLVAVPELPTNTSVSVTMPSASSFGQQVKAIATSLAQGGRGNNVTVLQQFLISQNKGPAAQALAKNGATTFFGAMTRAALAEFQAKVGISPALGNFGPLTRAYLGANY
jgi:hypothetical protein